MCNQTISSGINRLGYDITVQHKSRSLIIIYISDDEDSYLNNTGSSRTFFPSKEPCKSEAHTVRVYVCYHLTMCIQIGQVALARVFGLGGWQHGRKRINTKS